jgi:hypothetical protein
VLTDLIEDPSADHGAERDALAQDVFARVMSQVEGTLALDLERRLAQHLAPQVHAAVAGALGDLRPELARTIGNAVAEAMARRQVK